MSVYTIETPIAQGPAGPEGRKGDKGDKGDKGERGLDGVGSELFVSLDEGNQIEQRESGLFVAAASIPEIPTIPDMPSSSIADIDESVEKSHEHSNKSVVDALTDDGGMLQYNGEPVSKPVAVAQESGASADQVMSQAAVTEHVASEVSTMADRVGAVELAIGDISTALDLLNGEVL